MVPWAVQIKRVCRIKRFDIDTAWAVLVPSAEGWHLFGVRPNHESADALHRHCSNMGFTSVLSAQVGPLLGGEIVEDV